MKVEDILTKFTGVKQVGAGWVVNCPAHKDNKPSLSVGVGANGNVLMFCHAGCERSAILDAMNLKMADLFQQPPPKLVEPKEGAIVAEYDYRNVDGSLAYQSIRKWPKDFRLRRPDGAGGWVWKMAGVKWLPYRLPDLLACPMVFVVEGEKDADNLWKLGLPATTNAGGAGKWGASETKAVANALVKRVVILPDNDVPGLKHANMVASKCKAAGMAVSIIQLPNLPDKGDVSDWLKAGGTKDELMALAEGTLYAVPKPTGAPQGASGPSSPAPAGQSKPQGQSASPDALPDPTKYAVEGAGGIPYDLGAAQAFCDRFGNRLRYDHSRKRWLVWAGHYWTPDADSQVAELARQHVALWHAEALAALNYIDQHNLIRFTVSMHKKRSLDAMLDCAKTLKPISTDGREWDRDGWLLGVKNGVVDLRTGELRDGKPEDLITQQAGVAFNPEAECPRWHQFLSEVFGGDFDLITYTHKAFGYSLTADMREQAFFMAIGHGANGKSIMLDTIEHVWGSYGYRADMRIFAGQDADKFHLAELEGRRLVFASETKPNTRMNEHVIKSFTGGESVSAMRKFGQPFTFKPQGKIWLGVNHEPKVADDSYGFWRRIRSIPFNQTFTGSKEDRGLRDKLKAEAEGILAWAVLGCAGWLEEGLQAPQVVMAAVDAYQQQEDPLAEFFSEKCLTDDPHAVTGFSEIFAEYNTWAEAQGFTKYDRISRRAMAMHLRKLFDVFDETSAIKRYRGIRLRSGSSTTPHQAALPTEGD